jgi:hypothetical protein
MLPMTLQFIIVMIASAINDRMQRKLDYVEEERRILREQLDAASGGKKLSFTADQRRRLATAGKMLTPVLSRKSSPRFSHEFAPIWSLEGAAMREQSGPLMLPMTLQFIIVMIASAINDRLQRKLDYIVEERRILREQLDAVNGGKRLSFTADQRRRLAVAGRLLISLST